MLSPGGQTHETDFRRTINLWPELNMLEKKILFSFTAWMSSSIIESIFGLFISCLGCTENNNDLEDGRNI